MAIQIFGHHRMNISKFELISLGGGVGGTFLCNFCDILYKEVRNHKLYSFIIKNYFLFKKIHIEAFLDKSFPTNAHKFLFFSFKEHITSKINKYTNNRETVSNTACKCMFQMK